MEEQIISRLLILLAMEHLFKTLHPLFLSCSIVKILPHNAFQAQKLTFVGNYEFQT